MSYTPGPPEDDCYAPLSHDQAQALSDAIDQYQLQQRPWWKRVWVYPCFAVLVVGQLIRQRWTEWRAR